MLTFPKKSAGNILGSNLYTTEDAPRYTRGLVSNLVLFVAIIVFVGIGVAYIRFLNAKHAGMRERLGKSAEIVDYSMASSKALAEHDEAIQVGDKAFDDVTDLLNEDFVYVY